MEKYRTIVIPYLMVASLCALTTGCIPQSEHERIVAEVRMNQEHKAAEALHQQKEAFDAERKLLERNKALALVEKEAMEDRVNEWMRRHDAAIEKGEREAEESYEEGYELGVSRAAYDAILQGGRAFALTLFLLIGGICLLAYSYLRRLKQENRFLIGQLIGSSTQGQDNGVMKGIRILENRVGGQP